MKTTKKTTKKTNNPYGFAPSRETDDYFGAPLGHENDPWYVQY